MPFGVVPRIPLLGLSLLSGVGLAFPCRKNAFPQSEKLRTQSLAAKLALETDQFVTRLRCAQLHEPLFVALARLLLRHRLLLFRHQGVEMLFLLLRLLRLQPQPQLSRHPLGKREHDTAAEGGDPQPSGLVHRHLWMLRPARRWRHRSTDQSQKTTLFRGVRIRRSSQGACADQRKARMPCRTNTISPANSANWGP